MNTGTIIVLLIVILIVAGIIFKMVRDKKKGRSSCGCDCSSCGGACHCCDESNKKE